MKFEKKKQRVFSNTTQAKNENPFDKFANTRKKHEVLNRKVKGEDRNVGRARKKAMDERKSKLLEEYHKNRRSNQFQDKRFGENDANLSLEEKMFGRFQKERQRKSRKSSNIFNLDSNNPSEVLTHKGNILGASTINEDIDWMGNSDNDDDDPKNGKISKEMVDSLHFGGGLKIKKQSENSPDEEKDLQSKYINSLRLTSLQEIVMKSKFQKMQKKEVKEELEADRLNLDKAFASLVQDSSLDFKPIKRLKGSGIHDEKEGETAVDEYDRSLKEMMFETKVRATDRIKTDAEIALETQKRYETLEQERLKRMKSLNEPLGGDGKKSTVNANVQRRRNDDEIDDFHVDKDGKMGYADDIRGMSRGRDEADEAEEGEGDEADNGEEDELGDGQDDPVDEEWDDDDDDADDDEEEEEIDEDDVLDYDEEMEKRRKLKLNPDQSNAKDEEDEDDDESEDGRGNRVRSKERNVLIKAMKMVDDTITKGINLEMPYKIVCPNDLESFDELVAQYLKKYEADMMALVDRIIAFNDPNLPGPQGKINKNLMHNFLDVLMKHFIRVGDALALCDLDINQREANERQLDYLTTTIFNLCQSLPDACISLTGRTIKIFHERLLKGMRDFALGNMVDSCWPSLGKILYFQLLGHIYSVSDRQHNVILPSIMFLCQCLTQCPVVSPKDVASGLLICSILMEYTKESHRYIPEILYFSNSVLAIFRHEDTPSSMNAKIQITFHVGKLSNLRQLAANYSDCFDEKLMKPATTDHHPLSNLSQSITFPKISWTIFAKKSSDEPKISSRDAVALLCATYEISARYLQRYANQNCFPELVHPVIDILKVIRPHTEPFALQQLHLEYLVELLKLQDKVIKSRTPLKWRVQSVKSIDMKSPRFKLDYAFKKDTESDENKVKLKQLNRQLKREKRAAMRELRRDSDFIEQERYKEKQQLHKSRQEERIKNYGWMEEQQATINQQVRQGKGLTKGGGSAVFKKARIKRL